MEWRKAHANLQKNGRHKRQHAAADASGKAAEQPETVGRVFKQVQAEQRLVIAASMPQIPCNGGNADNHQQPEHQGRNPQPLLPVECQGKRGHARRQQNKAEEIKAPGLHFVVRHQRQGGHRADDAYREID